MLCRLPLPIFNKDNGIMNRAFTYKGKYTIAYAEYGDSAGFPVLVQHGLIASINDYDLFDRLIRLRTRLICIARPGYGRSSPYAMHSFAEWSEIAAVLADDLGLPEFDILGMSSGAPYSYAIASQLPERVRNVFIFSGIPALYDETVRSFWPYEMAKDATIEELEELAHRLFFSDQSAEDGSRNDIRDSMMNNCFGVAQDLLLRSLEWGFSLSQIKASVFMRHSKTDDAVPYRAAVRTAELLPNCRLNLVESGPHFSKEALDEFTKNEMTRHYLAGK